MSGGRAGPPLTQKSRVYDVMLVTRIRCVVSLKCQYPMLKCPYQVDERLRMTLQEFTAQVLADREAQRKANLAKSQAFLATLSKKEGK